MKEGIKTTLKEAVKALNAYTVFQFAWLIELYYLGVNILFAKRVLVQEIISGFGAEDGSLFPVPEAVTKWNDLILNSLNTYMPTLLLLAVSLFLLGLLFSLFQLSFLEKYNNIFNYSGFGLYAGEWLFIIWFTYSAYSDAPLLFLLLAPASACLHVLVDKIKSHL